MGAARQNTSFPGPAGTGSTLHGHLALPPAGLGPGVLVVQEWWGLTRHVADLTDRLAAAGFTALAPDLYGGTVTHDRDEAARMKRELPVEHAAEQLAAAVDHLLAHPATVGDAIGVAGFCMGGGLALRLAVREGDRIAAAVPFYGLPDPDYRYDGLTAHVLGHFGEQDASLPVPVVDEAAARIGEATGRRPEIHFYPAGHAFLNDEKTPSTYDPLQAEIAWRRTLSFLWGHLG
ncbi:MULTISPECIES: dienelactone hydrolase family protein [Kitasatospora]|uniref:Putative carboxymethylenebutenolidase n=1 Tax=Kitasatospora setae (strain ATCC 33774 / DSM 43861 / JCM 3304 / KCC A-0304 / NBRC 14216 / KM-6054) TaxID=452652 RepID=E4N323_KITSK|nr:MULTISPECIES: dienelactone hydrolase family protein [Kitasatospora]BAJ32557.1 putative carboxymethylenebutenolidase [Kitasatospora setae KM-6054]